MDAPNSPLDLVPDRGKTRRLDPDSFWPFFFPGARAWFYQFWTNYASAEASQSLAPQVLPIIF